LISKDLVDFSAFRVSAAYPASELHLSKSLQESMQTKPQHIPGESACGHFRTFAKAKLRARVLGVGARVYRNFQPNK
jgi:hypothetical protein